MPLLSWYQLACSQGLCWQRLQSASVLAEKSSLRIIFFFFFFSPTEKPTQLFKYSFFCPFSSLLPAALIYALFVAGAAGFVTTL